MLTMMIEVYSQSGLSSIASFARIGTDQFAERLLIFGAATTGDFAAPRISPNFVKIINAPEMGRS